MTPPLVARVALLVGLAATVPVARAQAPVHQQMGRLIKRAAGARSKRGDKGKIQRAQVQGELISSYTLLEKAGKKA